jgi:hypothetical protein
MYKNNRKTGITAVGNRNNNTELLKHSFLESVTCKGDDTRAAPKVMPPIYFHGNYNRYKEHNNTI